SANRNLSNSTENKNGKSPARNSNVNLPLTHFAPKDPTMRIETVNKKRIRSSPINARKKSLSGERRNEFLNSVITHGIKVPLIGVEDASKIVTLIDGNFRFDVGLETGLEEFPVCLLDRMPGESELLTVQCVINGMRNDVCIVDLYETYEKLIQLNG